MLQVGTGDGLVELGVDGSVLRRALVGTTEARLVLVGGPDGPATDRAFDDIPTRDGWSTPWGAPADLRSLTMAGTRPLAGVHVGGVWRRDDDGWIEIVPAEADDHQVLADEDVIAVAAAIGVGQSTDGGDTWAWSHEGLHASYCLVAAGNLAAVGERYGRVYLSEDAGLSWRKLADALPGVHCLAFAS